MRNNVAACIQNLQTSCTPDAKSLCPDGKSIIAKKTAVTEWKSSSFERHMYDRFDQIPLGFGDMIDNCLRSELKHQSSKRLTPKCAEWMTKTKDQFNLYHEREKGDDKREGFVIFSTFFATALSCAVGYLVGLYKKEHDDILAFSYERRRESKKIFVMIAVAISVPACIILFTCPRLLALMTLTFFVGRALYWYMEKKQDTVYSAVVSGLEESSGLVFAAIPVQMD